MSFLGIRTTLAENPAACALALRVFPRKRQPSNAEKVAQNSLFNPEMVQPMKEDTMNHLINVRRSILHSMTEIDSLLEDAALSAVSRNVAWEPHKGVQESSQTNGRSAQESRRRKLQTRKRVSGSSRAEFAGHRRPRFHPLPEDVLLSGAHEYESYGRFAYLAACPRQLALSRALDISLAKPGCAKPGRLKIRMTELSDQGYGAAAHRWRLVAARGGMEQMGHASPDAGRGAPPG